MDLSLNETLADGYRSASQRARVLTEPWTAQNVPCPYCGGQLRRLPTGEKVRDLTCIACAQDYQLKSTKRQIGRRVLGGAYGPTMDSLRSATHPSLLLLRYDPCDLRVQDLLFVPHSFLTARVVGKRNRLRATARRAGWQGCVFQLDEIPSRGKLWLVREGTHTNSAGVQAALRRLDPLISGTFPARGWLHDVLRCAESLPTDFTLADMYEFERELEQTHPRNRNVRAKIRQQLQLLRNAGFLRFLGGGRYRRVL